MCVTHTFLSQFLLLNIFLWILLNKLDMLGTHIKFIQVLGSDFKIVNTLSDSRFAYFVDSNIQTFPSTEIQDKITGGSRPPGDADGKC